MKSIQERADIVLREIDAAIALAEKATPGPWWNESCVLHCKAPEWTDEVHACDHPVKTERDEDGDFIAAARTLVPTSLRCLKAAIELMLMRMDGGWTDDILRTLCAQWEKIDDKRTKTNKNC